VDTTLFTLIGHHEFKKDVADMLKALDGQTTKTIYTVKELLVFPTFNRFLGKATLAGIIDSHISSGGTMPLKLTERMFSFLDEKNALAHAQLVLTWDQVTGPAGRELVPETMYGMHVGAILDGDRVMRLVTVTKANASRSERKEVPVD
jgi:hypothetical protein